MPYMIRVFNSVPIAAINPRDILAAITESNYYTLCGQYGLDPAQIAPGLARLGVLAAPDSEAPFFTVVYRPDGERPLVVSFQDWDPAVSATEDLLPPKSIQGAFVRTAQLVSVEVEEDQLRDLGLLLAYELARWAAVQGHGIIRALDGRWYRLNAHKAFLPVGDGE